MILHTLPFFCIHVSSAVDRRKHFEAQFEAIGVKRLTIIEALTPDAPVIEALYGRGYPRVEDHWATMVACFASHLKALRAFVESTSEPYALICEDDVCFRKDFATALQAIWDNMPEGCPLVALSYWHERSELTPAAWAGCDPARQNLAPLGDTAGALLYLISRAWAAEALQRFDRPFVEIVAPVRTSEAITLSSDGLLAHPLLAIERPNNTSLLKPNDPRHVAKHVAFYQRWGLDNFLVDGQAASVVFRPAFSPSSRYVLRDHNEVAYFSRHGGAPEARLIDWALQLSRPDQSFIDVGAHVGTWTQHFAQKCKKVHAFEPQRSTYDRLCEGIRLAEIGNIECHAVALGSSGEVDLHVVSVDGGGSTLHHRSELGSELAVERVQAGQIDDFTFENVGLIKIDAEGAEGDILRGATRTLETHGYPTLLVEAWLHGWYAQERAALIAQLEAMGYHVQPVMNCPETLLAEHPSRRKSEETASETPRPVARRELLAGERPLLGLVMIVKNEAKRIALVLDSYRPHIDRWTILDTGSTDGTQDLIRRELADIPGDLHEEPFVDFATSRNRALELHGTATVFSFMPNGDVLDGGEALVSFLQAHRIDRAGAYRVRISPGHYYHPLVMRTGHGWRYKWRTHECATGANLGPMIPGVTVVRDRGTRTDEEWRARWTRDLDLLNRDREADPNDPRPYFYLGQTHECLGQPEQALPFFEQRAKMGGYFDEVYEAKFRIGKMKDELDRPWAEVQQAYLEAYAHDPRRAEPLYAIAEHWYDKVHPIARIFATTAAELPKPPTDLFLDEEIYRWKAADMAAISSFYAGFKAEGRRWADEVVRRRPGDERSRMNRAFYAQSMGELFGAKARAIDFSPEPGWQVSNPSISSGLGRLRCIVRTVNYKIVGGRYVTRPEDVVQEEGRWKGWQVIRTRNFLLDLDDDLKTTGTVELTDATGEARTNYPVHGFEDARLFAWRDKWWATATVCDFTEDGQREIALLDIGADGAIARVEPLRGTWSEHTQKNWMPLVDGDAAKFIYATDPKDASPTIFELAGADDRDVPRLSWHVARRHAIGCALDATFGHGRLRGGSQAVRFDDGWLCVVHDVAFSGSGRFYLHRFVFLSASLELVSMTDLFYFERLGIEFCAGLARIGDDFAASYSVNDGSARLGIFSATAVRRALRTDFVI